jgi:hypothetical protein
VIARFRLAAARHPDRTAAAALALLLLLVFAPAVFGGRIFFERDILFYWYPHIENAVQAVAEGGWPSWTPYVAFGRPLLADPSFQLLYPPTWLNLLMPPERYYTVFVVGHAWGAGFGAYLLARTCGLPPLAAGATGAVWVVSGPFLSAANLFHHFAGAAWMPWVLRAGVRAAAEGTAASALKLGALAGGQALAGSADMCVFTGVAGAVYAAGWLRTGRGALAPRLVAGLRTIGLAGAFAALLAAVQWLPAAALLRQGTRASGDLAVVTSWSVHPASLADILVPRLVADLPVGDDLRAALFDGRAPLLVSLYLGIAALPLVALAVVHGGEPVRRFAIPGLVLFLIIALGRHTPAAALLALPPFSMLRYPAKYMVPASLFWALLAGCGLHAWTQVWASPVRARASAVAVGCALLAAVLLAATAVVWSPVTLRHAPLLAGGGAPAVAGKLALAALTLAAATALLAVRARRAATAGWLTAACGAVAVGDVAAAGRGVNPLAVPALVHYRPAAVEAIASDAGARRLHVRPERLGQFNDWIVKGPGGWDTPAGWALGMQDLLLPPAAARWRIAGSYDGDFTGLARPALSLLSLALPDLADDPLALKLLRIGAVTHVTSLHDRPYPGLETLGAFSSVFTRPVQLHRVPDPLPRVYLVGGARAAASENEALALMAESQFDPRREVILPAGAATHPPGSGFQGTVRATAARMDRMEADVELNAPGWLVAVEAYDPGWQARVDGRATEVLPANALFRAVLVPAGRHRVEMSYRPPGLAAGALLSASAAALALAAAGPRRFRAAREPREGAH